MTHERKTIHVISNTHWDREWAYPFEETRLLLLDFMDGLLDTLDKSEEFHSFLFDSQTVALEDYLELRPEKRETIEKHVRSGRLVIGPWYSLPEEYIVNGESLVRNLVVGHRVAKSLGKVSKLGYTPFGQGQTSQMPQIYTGFDIDTIVFHRGISTPKSEFVMEGPDGSRLLGTRFGALSRFSFYFYIYRMLVHGKGRDDWEYDWDRGACPFRLATDRHPGSHYYVLDEKRKQWNRDIIPEMLVRLVREESEHFSSQHIACMQGFDLTGPDPRETQIIQLCQEIMHEHTIKHSSLEDFMEAIRKEVKDPPVITGEIRDPSDARRRAPLYGDVISARMRIKQANARNESNLQRWAEPWSAIGSMVGAEYMKSAMDRCWRLLLQNQAHHTIGGTGTDQTEQDFMFRSAQVDTLCGGIMRRGMGAVQARVDNSDLDEKDVLLTVFNPSPFPRSEVISCCVDLPDGTDYEAFSVQTPEGEMIRKQEAERYPFGTLVRNLQDVSQELRSARVRCHLDVKDIPALGYQTLHLVREEQTDPLAGTLAPENNVLENEHLRVEINQSGTLDVTCKAAKHTFKGLHYFDDSGETGHSWVHMSPDQNEVVTSLGAPATIVLEEAGPLLARFRVDYYMRIPVGLDDNFTSSDRGGEKNHTRRSSERREVVVTSRFTLRAGQNRLDVQTTVENTCRNHRLRVVFPTHLKTNNSDAAAGFDVISRPIAIDKDSLYYGRPNPSHPMQRFVDVSSGKVGLGLLNRGIREFEVTDTPERPVALTLLRAFTYRQNPVFERWEAHPEMELSQCLGKHEWVYSIYPHTGDWTQGVYEQAECFDLPLEAGQAGPHKGTLPKAMRFLELKGGNLQLTAFKRAEDRKGSYVARLFNPTDKPVAGTLKAHREIKRAWLTNLNEERKREIEPKGRSLRLTVGKKKIVTVEFQV